MSKMHLNCHFKWSCEFGSAQLMRYFYIYYHIDLTTMTINQSKAIIVMQLSSVVVKLIPHLHASCPVSTMEDIIDCSNDKWSSPPKFHFEENSSITYLSVDSWSGIVFNPGSQFVVTNKSVHYHQMTLFCMSSGASCHGCVEQKITSPWSQNSPPLPLLDCRQGLTAKSPK